MLFFLLEEKNHIKVFILFDLIHTTKTWIIKNSMKIIFSLSDILFSLWIPPQHHITTKNSDGNPARFFPFIFSRILFLTTKRTRKKNHGTSFLSFLFFFFYLLLLLSLLLIYKELLKYKKTLYAYISLSLSTTASFHHSF